MRVIQFYNFSGYHCADETEDGFAPGADASNHHCSRHTADSEQDWKISLSELLRVIQLFNSEGYHCANRTEDGFAPGYGNLCFSDIVFKADFSCTATTGAAPFLAKFTDESIVSGNGSVFFYDFKELSITSWEWDFGDGTTSTQSNPVHTYQKAGNYTVRLTIKDGPNNLSDTYISEESITVVEGEDSDNDGLSNAMETSIGTDPFVWDTDNDGINDYAEYVGGTDPNTPELTVKDGVTFVEADRDMQVVSFDDATNRLVLEYSGKEKDALSFVAGNVVIVVPKPDELPPGTVDRSAFCRIFVVEEASNSTKNEKGNLESALIVATGQLTDAFSKIDVNTWGSQEVNLIPSSASIEEPKVIVDKPNIKVRLDKLDASFNSRVMLVLNYDEKWGYDDLREFDLYIEGTLLFDMQFYVGTFGSFERDYPIEIIPASIPIPIGGPVCATIDLDALITIQANGEMSIAPHKYYSADIKIGLHYDPSTRSFQEIIKIVKDNRPIELNPVIKGDASIELAVTPTIGVSVMSCAGVEAGINPYLKASASADLFSDDCKVSASVDMGLYGSLRFYAEKFGVGADFEMDTSDNPVEWNLWQGCAWGKEDSFEIVQLPDNTTLEMVKIPAGNFLMGSSDNELDQRENEIPQHIVSLTQDFWLGKYEVTKRQWTAVMNTTPWSGQDIIDWDSPATHISWNDAQDFVAAVNDYTGCIFSLPREAQWEYACRANSTRQFYWGNDSYYTNADKYSWNTNNALHDYAYHVGKKLPNDYGLYDMGGNIAEWCQDQMGGYPSFLIENYAGPTAGALRIIRGGSWRTTPAYCRSASRVGESPGTVI